MNIDKALNLLEKAVELEPSEDILDSLGWAYFLSNSFEQSVYFLEKAVFLPNDPTLNDHLGDAYWKSGRYDEAQSQWKRVLIIDPDFKTKNIVRKNRIWYLWKILRIRFTYKIKFIFRGYNKSKDGYHNLESLMTFCKFGTK